MKHIGWDRQARNRQGASSIGEAVTELKLILAHCREHIAASSGGSEAAEQLSDAARKIEAAIELLQADAPATEMATAAPDIENPSRELPTCSASGCSNAAGAVIDGDLFCGLHASQALLRRGYDRS
jgi:hypothetical protein